MEKNEVLNRRYEIQATLGEGVFATTYLALDREKNQKCVVKALSLRHVDTIKTQELFEREGRVLSHLNHPNIPKFIDFFTIESEQDIRIYLVQEYIEGKNLAQLVEEGQHFTEREILQIGLDIARILVYLHSLSPQIIHRDIKPSNILITPDKRVYLIDFGAVRDKLLHDPLLQLGGPTIVGTFGYMPMEQFEGRAEPASDIYSLGATLIYLLSHIEPWQMEKDGMRLDFRAHVKVSKDFAKILQKMIEPDWNKRFQSASRLKESLTELLSSKPPSQSRRLERFDPKLLISILILVAAFLFVQQKIGVQPGKISGKISSPSSPHAEKDLLGDPIPRGAILRLGTVRLRHGRPVKSVAFSPNGKILATGSEDETISLWEVATGKELHRIEQWSRVSALAFSPDGAKLVSASENDGTLYFWEVATGKPILRLKGPRYSGSSQFNICPLAFSPDGRMLASAGPGSIQIWEGVRGEPLFRKIEGRQGEAGFVIFSPDGKTLISASRGKDAKDGTVQFWDIATGKQILTKSLEKNGDPISSLILSPDGKFLATGGNRITLWEAATGKETVRLSPSGVVLAFSPNGRIVAARTGSDSSISLWDSATGKRLLEFQGQHSLVNAAAFSPDGKTLATGSSDCTVRLWDVATGKEIFGFPGHEGQINSLAFSSDGRTILSGSADSSVRHWDAVSGREIFKRLFDTDVLWVNFLPDGKALASRTDRFHVWDLSTGWQILETPFKKYSTKTAFALSPDSRKIATVGYDSIDIWDVNTGRRLLQIQEENAMESSSLAFSPQSNILASARGGRTITLWDLATGKELSKTNVESNFAYSVRFSSDGGSLISSGTYLTVWEITKDKTLKFLNHLGPGGFLSPDGKILARTNYSNNAIDLYEISPVKKDLTPKKLGTLQGHRGNITSVAFSPDGKTLASGSADSSVLLWNLERHDWLQDSIQPTPNKSSEGQQNAPPKIHLGFDGNIKGPGIIPTRFSETEGGSHFVPGKQGEAVRLDGSIEFPEAQKIVLEKSSFTVQFWFQMEEGALWKEGAYQALVNSDLVTFDVRNGGDPYLFIGFINKGGNNTVSLREHMGKIVPGRWYHLAVVHDGSKKTLLVYLDGKLLLTREANYGLPVSDKIGLLRLGGLGPKGSTFQGVLDEFTVYDYARTPQQIAKDGLQEYDPRQMQMPERTSTAEKPVLPKDVSGMIEVEQHPAFTVYRLAGNLSNTQLLDLDVSQDSVWIGTAKGLLRYESKSGNWSLYGADSGIPGERVEAVAVVQGGVAVDLSRETKPGYSLSKGAYLFETEEGRWNPLNGSCWKLYWDGKNLWTGLREGAELRDLKTGATFLYTTKNSGLLHGDVHAIKVSKQTAWFAMLGDYVKETRDFTGGGVSRLDLSTGEWKSYTTKDGLARAYSCDLAVDDQEVWVAHWDEGIGLSAMDLATRRWTAVRRSANGMEVGGVRLAIDGRTLWIGQQRGLVKLDRKTLQATLYTEKEGLPGYIVSGIAVGKDSVWVSAYSYGSDGVRSSGIVRIPH